MKQSETLKNGSAFGLSTWLTFLIPSLTGLLLFVTPVFHDGSLTISVTLLAGTLRSLIGQSLTTIIAGVITVTATLTLVTKLFSPRWVIKNTFLSGLFDVSPMWSGIRLLGAVFALFCYFESGPDFIRSIATGGMVFNDLMPTLFSVFIFAGLLLPLLMSFGLLEFFGALMTRIMRPVFNLPGRSAIDCIASWLGDGSVGILMTSKQYESSHYTQREAAVIGTTFSAVSISFALVVIAQVELEHMFVPFYLTVCVAGIVAAIIVPRLPPLSRKRDTFISNQPLHAEKHALPNGESVFSLGLKQALTKAKSIDNPMHVLMDGLKNAVDMVFGILPVVMAVGTLALVISEYTPIFTWLGMPFVPLLELLQIPEASTASQAMVVGFADMFVPSILATTIESEMTRFVIAALSLTQLIYMSEVGALLLGSRIPVTFAELFVIFILRTLVTLPVITGMAHLFF